MRLATKAFLELLAIPRGAVRDARAMANPIARALVNAGWTPDSTWFTADVARRIFPNLAQHKEIIQEAAAAAAPAAAPAAEAAAEAAAAPAPAMDGVPIWRFDHRGSLGEKCNIILICVWF